MSASQDSRDSWADAVESEADSALGRVNIGIFGPTGAGKSSLINAIFGADVAPTGVGEPVTAETALYVNATGTLGIYDGAGFELGERTKPVAELRRRISRNRRSSGGPEDYIHVAWYCVNAGTSRLEAGQARAIRELARTGIPVVLVLTKVSVRGGELDPAHQALVDAIAGMDLPVVGGRPVPTAAVEDTFNGTSVSGLQELLDITYRVVPEAQREAIAAAQRIDLAIKARYARSWIAGTAAFAGGVGFTPIPVVDAAVLVPAQAALMAKISALYEIPKHQSAKLAAGATTLASAGGKQAAASLVKLVPGVGNVISAGVAGTITAVLGESWRAVSERAFTGKIDLDDAAQLTTLAEAFTANVRKGRGGPEETVDGA